MWSLLFESFAEAFGLTRRLRPLVLALVIGLSLALIALAFAEGGPRGVIALGFVLGLTVWSAWQVLSARDAVWRAARRGLEDPRQRPDVSPDQDLPPTARALRRLARAVDEARRARFAEAARTLDAIDRSKLRAEEERLLEATTAMVSLGLGDAAAAQRAERVLPTASDDLDVQLGRAVVADAWSSADRLRAIDETWAAQGVEPGTREPLPRLRALLRLRIDTSAIQSLPADEAKALADEARAVGDEALAADLEARVRPTAYR